MLTQPKRHLEAEDKVNVYFEYTPCIFNATILYTPHSPDDSFTLSLEDGRVVDVKLYSKIEQVKDDN